MKIFKDTHRENTPSNKTEDQICVWIADIHKLNEYGYLSDSQLTFTCSKSTIETTEQGVKYVQS